MWDDRVAVWYSGSACLFLGLLSRSCKHDALAGTGFLVEDCGVLAPSEIPLNYSQDVWFLVNCLLRAS